MPVDTVDGIAIVEEKTIHYAGGQAIPWTSVYIKFLVAFRRQALRELKGAPLSVFICLALRVNESGFSEPSLETIMRETGYGRATVCSALDRLHDLRLVERVKRWKQNNRYHIRGYAWFGYASQPALFEQSMSSETELHPSESSVSEPQNSDGVQKLNSKIIDDDDSDPEIIINNDLSVRKIELHTADEVQKLNPIFEQNRQTCHQYRIGEPTATELANLSHVTPAYIRAWFEERDYHNDIARHRRDQGSPWGIGYLITQMRAGINPPQFKSQQK